MADAKVTMARLPPLSTGRLVAVSTKGNNHADILGGRTYKLNNMEHSLPSPKTLKPYVDTKAGELDTWPAHASGQILSGAAAMLSKNNRLVLVNEEENGKPRLIPKPRFLEQLENFLKKELRALGVTEVIPSELRLQAHREVFEYLIDDFKTYRPLLASVKNEYEMMLASQRHQIRELEPLRQMLVTVSEQCDQKVMLLREEEKQEMVEMKNENRKLNLYISTMKNQQKDLDEQVSRLQEKLKEEYRKYRDQYDARKILVSDINDLRYQQQDFVLTKQSLHEAEQAGEDPVTLKIALRQAREDEKKASMKLNEMVANYGDVIPRRDYESLQTNFKEMEKKSGLSQIDFCKLQMEHETLLDINKQVTQQRDEFYLELENLKRSSTPRPDWSRCADHINGGMMRWSELSDGKSSDELVYVLLQEIGSGGFVDLDGADFFEGKGTGPEVPIYLRYEGKIRNRRLCRRDCALLIKDIWQEKGAHDAQKEDGIREVMSEFLHMYLKRRFSVEMMTMEWAYNLFDAMQRFASDDNIGLFLGVLNGEIDEEVYHVQLLLIQKLITALTKIDSENKNDGTITHEDFRVGLKEFFQGMNEEGVNALMQAVDQELEIKEDEDFDYKSLFMEDDEGKTAAFLDGMKKWLKDEQKAYIAEIAQQLDQLVTVSPDDVKRALSLCDPEISSEQIDAYLAWAFKVPTDKIYDCNPIELKLVLARMETGNVFRVGPKI